MLFLFLVSGFGLSGCSTDTRQASDGAGRVDFSLASDLSLAESGPASRATVPGLIEPGESDFNLTVVHDAYAREVYDGVFTDYPNEELLLEVGSHTATATFGDIDQEGFGSPCFGATESFTVVKDDTAVVEMTATLKNMAVRVDYTDEFKAYMSNYSATIARDGAGIATFAKGETRAAFVKPEPFEIKVNYTLPFNGVAERTGSRTYTIDEDIDEATLLNIEFGVNGGEVGSVEVTIAWGDMTPITLDPVDVGETEEEPLP